MATCRPARIPTSTNGYSKLGAGQATLRLGVNYTGWMDEIAIYRRPLTAAEIAKARQQQRPKK